MPLKSRDAIFLLLIAVVVAVLLVSNLRDKPPALPDDERHRPFVAALSRGEERTSVEEGCVTCHNPRQRPLSPKHPPKEQCLICHPGKG
jgi:hypothetical protein